MSYNFVNPVHKRHFKMAYEIREFLITVFLRLLFRICLKNIQFNQISFIRLILA